MLQLSKKYHVHPLLLALLFLGVLIFASVLIGQAVQRIGFIQSFDAIVYRAIHQGYHAPWLDMLIRPFNFNFLPYIGTSFMSFLFLIIAACIAFLFFKNKQEGVWFVLTCVLAFVVGNILFELNSLLIFRERPFLHLPNNLDEASMAIWKAWPSYPSGHSRDTALFSTIIAAFIPKLRYPVLILTLFVAFSRVYLGAHYPTDVLAGIIIGFLVGKIILSVIEEFRAILKRRNAPPPAET